jgi:hypothetical protein
MKVGDIVHNTATNMIGRIMTIGDALARCEHDGPTGFYPLSVLEPYSGTCEPGTELNPEPHATRAIAALTLKESCELGTELKESYGA